MSTEYPHPGYRGRLYPITTVLLDLASQEHCDGEPFDVMVAAAEYIKRMEQERDFLLARIDEWQSNSNLCHDDLRDWDGHVVPALERMRPSYKER